MRAITTSCLLLLVLAGCDDVTGPQFDRARPEPLRSTILGPNLAPNPSFEIGTAGQPAGWTPNPNGVPASFDWETAFGRSGQSALKISATDGAPSVPLANPGWRTSDFIPIQPGTKYEASVYTFTSNGGVGHIPAIQFFTATGSFLGTIGATSPSGFADPLDIWVKKTYDFDVANFPGLLSATQVRLVVVQDIYTTKGTPTSVLFDDFYFGEVLDAAAIAIDIKPGSDTNSINCTADRAIVPVAILTTANFDAAAVDHTTVSFEGAEEVHTDPKTGEPRRHVEDVDGDGNLDLVFHFRLGDTDLTCESTSGSLDGLTFGATPVHGTDTVRMVG